MKRWQVALCVAASMMLAWSCKPAATEDTSTPTTGAPHADFPILGGHRGVECEDCHVDGAREQGLEGDDDGWVTELGLGCLGCHTDTRDLIFPNGHKQQASCADSGCHSASDNCWRNVRGDCVVVPTGEPPPPVGHEGARGLLFPLAGPHDLAVEDTCSVCHTGASDADQRGGAQRCEMCHDRPAGHKPAERNQPQDDRMCKACHAREAVDGRLLVPPDWDDGTQVEHEFYWPHNRIQPQDETTVVQPKAESEWVVACNDCHQPGTQNATDFSCSKCHVYEAVGATEPTQTPLSTFHDNFQAAPCNSCHEKGDKVEP